MSVNLRGLNNKEVVNLARKKGGFEATAETLEITKLGKKVRK